MNDAAYGPDYKVALLEHYITPETYYIAVKEYERLVKEGYDPARAFMKLTDKSPHD